MYAKYDVKPEHRGRSNNMGSNSSHGDGSNGGNSSSNPVGEFHGFGIAEAAQLAEQDINRGHGNS